MANFKTGDVVVNKNHKDDVRQIIFVGKTAYFYNYTHDPLNECSASVESMNNRFTLKPKEITITRDDLAKAWDRALPFSNSSKDSASFDTLCKELGLE